MKICPQFNLLHKQNICRKVSESPIQMEKFGCIFFLAVPVLQFAWQLLAGLHYTNWEIPGECNISVDLAKCGSPVWNYHCGTVIQVCQSVCGGGIQLTRDWSLSVGYTMVLVTDPPLQCYLPCWNYHWIHPNRYGWLIAIPVNYIYIYIF